MKRLNRQQSSEFADHESAIQEAQTALESALEDFNNERTRLWDELKEALDKTNGALSEFNSWRADIASDMESYYDDRSDRWREGDAGEAYSEWQGSWDNELSELDLDEPEALEMPEVTVPDEDEYPSEPGGM